MARVTSVQKRVNEGVRVLTAVYGTRRVWGIGPRAVLNGYDVAEGIFERLGINYDSLTDAVNEAGLKVKRLSYTGPQGEVDGVALGFYSADDDGGTNEELKTAWANKLREMRAESIGSTARTTVARTVDTDYEPTTPVSDSVYFGC